MPTPGHSYMQLVGGDPSGRYLVGAGSKLESSGWVSRTLVWERGKLRPLDTEPLRPYVQIDPTGVNEQGVIIGYRMADFTYSMEAWVYRDGRFTMLPGLQPTDETWPVAINSRGDIAGTTMAIGTTPGPWHAVVWPADQPGTVRELTVPVGAGQTLAFDIDDDGTVLGFAGPRPGSGDPYVWPPHGAPYPLLPPPGFTDDNTEGQAIRNGVVVGYGQQIRQPADRMVGLRWDLHDDASVEMISTEYVGYSSINQSGTVASLGALIHRDGRVVRLRSEGLPVVVSDDGNAAGNLIYLSVPVVWNGC